jgi:release factor glutamine methyltransferase
MSRPASSGPTASVLISDIARSLATAGIEGARTEAELIVRAVCDVTAEKLILRPEAELTSGERERALALASRRARREPLPYLLGRAEFYSLPFSVSPASIVPRPETEILAEAAMERARRTAAKLGADVGTGCGVLASVLARHLHGLRVAATDISSEALVLARENARRHRVAKRVLSVRCDLLTAVTGPLDFVVANLPYVRTRDIDQLLPEIRDFEPRAALDGGADGLCVIRRLSVQLFDHLATGGFAALEVGAGQASEVENLLARGGLRSIEVVRDYAGIDRVVIGWRRG